MQIVLSIAFGLFWATMAASLGFAVYLAFTYIPVMYVIGFLILVGVFSYISHKWWYPV